MGHDLEHETDDIKHVIGYMSQHFSLYGDLSVMENLGFSTIHNGPARLVTP